MTRTKKRGPLPYEPSLVIPKTSKPFASSAGSAKLSSPRPWSVYCTGDKLSIKDARGKFVFRKTVSALPSIEAYHQLKADFDAIVEAVNGYWPNSVLNEQNGARAL